MKYVFAFPGEILFQDSKPFHGKPDLDFLKNNIPLKETINICTDVLYNNVDIIEGINKS